MRHFIDAINGSLVMNGITTIGRNWSGADRRVSECRRGEFAVSASPADLGNVYAFGFRYGLVALFVWACLLKFATLESKNIELMLTISPIWS